jgi:hypothetical protein
MDSTNDGSLDQNSLGILLRCVKQGLPLAGVYQSLKLESPTFLRALSEKIRFLATNLKIALRMREAGKSLQDLMACAKFEWILSMRSFRVVRLRKVPEQSSTSQSQT